MRIGTRSAESRAPIRSGPGWARPVSGAAAVAAGVAVGGPVGAAVGAVVGAVAGGLGGKAVAEEIDPTAEDAYWRENYKSRPYFDKKVAYEHYRPAYRYGWEARSLYFEKTWDEIESELATQWPSRRGDSSLEWKNARHASRDAWDKIGAANRATVSDNI